jgi:hypothetical protein
MTNNFPTDPTTIRIAYLETRKMSGSALQRDLEKLRGLSFQTSSAQARVIQVIKELESELTNQEQASSKASSVNLKVNVPSVGLSRWDISIYSPNSSFECVIFGIHCFMLDSGFICLEEMKNSVPGFAPSIRELPIAKFLPDTWRSDLSSTTSCVKFMYKHATSKTRYTLKFSLDTNDSNKAAVELEKKNGEIEATTQFDLNEFNLPDSYTSSDSDTIFTNVNANILSSKVQDLLISAGIDNSAPTTASVTTATMQVDPDRSRVHPQTQPQPQPASSGFVDPRVGSGDVFPHFAEGPNGLQPPFPAGGLVGPDHPIFGQGQTNPYSGYPQPNNPLLPQPRFDPYGPSAGPNGPDLGFDGFDPRFPGRKTGEPDPDHLKPPDMPDLNNLGGPGRGGGRGRGGRGGPFGGGNPFG